jgi:hypothetical protein
MLSQERGATEALACLSLTYTATALVERESSGGGGWDNPPQRATTTALGMDDDPLSVGSRDSSARPEPRGGPIGQRQAEIMVRVLTVRWSRSGEPGPACLGASWVGGEAGSSGRYRPSLQFVACGTRVL